MRSSVALSFSFSFSFACAFLACARTEAPPPELTSAVVPSSLYARAHALDVAGECVEAKIAYERYARAVRARDPSSAELALEYASMCRPRARVDRRLTAAVTASLAGDDWRALALLDAAEPSAWRDYDRGVALADLRRPDEAARAFDAAAQAFAPGDVRDRSIAIFGKARAYHDAYRCERAADAYAEYASLVRPSDPASAAMAMRYAAECVRYGFVRAPPPPRGP